MKKVLSFMVTLCMVITIFAVVPVQAVAATSGTCGDNLTWELTGGTLVISGMGDMNDWYNSWYEYRNTIESVQISNGVTSIGCEAFYNCDRLTSINIPDSVTSIGYEAFSGCHSLTSIDIPDSVTSIGFEAFYNTGYYNDSSNWQNSCLYINNCLITAETDIASCKIKDGTVLISDNAFSSCYYLTSIEIPDSVTSIGSHAFSGCHRLTSVDIPDSVTSIGYQAFSYCDRLKSVHITDPAAWCGIEFANYDSNPLRYANDLFINGELVTNLIIPDNVTSIGSYAFYSCGSLTSIEIPDSVTSIGHEAFSGCHRLTSINIPDGVTSIGDRAFSSCSSLTSIDIPDSVTSIGSGAFSGCTGLTRVNISDIAAWCNIDFCSSSSNPLYYAQILYLNGKYTTALVIPDNVTSIGSYAFYNCASLKSIDIPDSVTSIGDEAFYDCNRLASIDISDSLTSIGGDVFYNTQYYKNSSPWEDNCLYIDKYLINAKTGITSCKIKEGTSLIADYAFSDCTSLTNIDIPDCVTSIGNRAFYNCTGLTTISASDNNSYFSSQDGVLFDKNKSEILCYPDGKTDSFTIPDSVTSIGNSAFYGCTDLTDVYYNGTMEEFAEIKVGSNNGYLKKAVLHFGSNTKAPDNIVGLRTQSAIYDQETNTIKVTALNTNASAGVAIEVDGVTSTSHYTTDSGNGFSVTSSNGYRYFVAKRANGEKQAAQIHVKLNGNLFFYNLEITFIAPEGDNEEPPVVSGSPIADIATLRCYEASWSDDKKTITVDVDRFTAINTAGSVGVAIIPAEDYTVSYEYIGNNSSSGTASKFIRTDTSKYTLLSTGVNTEISGGGALGEVPMRIITKADSTRFYVNVILTKDGTSTTYKMTVALRDPAVEGDVDISEILPLRADPESVVLDNEAKTIYYETLPGASSAGFAVSVDNNLTKATRPRKLLTAKSGMNLAHGNIKTAEKDTFDRYVVARRSAGTTQTYQVKVHGGDDGFTYTWYTVTVVFK